MATFARALHLSEEEVKQAFYAWQALGLVTVSESPSFSVAYHLAANALPQDSGDYPLSAFNARMNELFAPRTPTPAELSRIYDWMDVFGIAQDAVEVLVQYGREKMKDVGSRGVSAQINYIDKIAQDWAENGIKTLADAERFVAQQQQSSTGIAKLMRRMGMNRPPSASERKLFDSWLDSGFTLAAILAAADGMTGAYSPSFKYLDGMLQSLLEKGAMSEGDVKKRARLQKEMEDGTRQALVALGIQDAKPTASQMDAYAKALEDGFTHEHVLYACEVLHAAGKARFAEVTALLYSWRAAGLNRLSQMKKYQKAQAAATGDLEMMFSRMGITRRVAEADIKLYLQWTQQWGMPVELLFVAAEYAHGTNTPYQYTKKLLTDWHEKGIQKVSLAKKQYQSHAQSAGKANNPALQYEQRDNDAAELNDLFERL
ncbi:DnaD domain protein [Eubacteriales bacterium OttesenSCG-928-N14]|nr:DnaD domain protein [Eubacteriales bacterium OttesenSCG-928-N14]